MKKLSDLLQIAHYGMGNGDNELSLKLIGNYFKLIIEDNRLPSIIVFYNEGVKLLKTDSPISAYLKTIESKGITLMACKTCLDFYGIDRMCAGVKGTMIDIITLQSDAKKVINL